MPTAGLADILDALCDQLRNAYADDDFPFQVEPRLVPNPTAPTIDMYPSTPARDEDTAAFGDLAGGYRSVVRVRCGTNDYDALQDLLVEMMDDQNDLSLLAAVFDDETLNGNVSAMGLIDHSPLQVYVDLAGIGAFVGFQLDVVLIPGES